MTARALTIIETLLVIALVSAIAALGVPTLSRLMAPVTFEEACAQCELSVRLAASEARLRGEVMVVMARGPDGDGRTAIVAVALERVDEPRSVEDADALVVLPRGVVVRTHRRDREGAGLDAFAEDDAPQAGDMAACIVAYALPDGSVVAGPAVRVEMDGRVAGLAAAPMGDRLVVGPGPAADGAETPSGEAGVGGAGAAGAGVVEGGGG